MGSLRASPAHVVWRKVRERQFLSEYGALACQLVRELPRFGDDELRAALHARSARRLPIGERPGVLVVCARDWEANGLIQAFSAIGDATFLDKREARSRRGGLAGACLEAVRSRAKEGRPVALAFLYVDGRELAPEAVRALGELGVWTIAMCLDDKQLLLDRLPDGSRGGVQRELARAVDVYWTTFRGATDWLASIGARPWYAAEAADPERFRPVEVPARDIDVLWLGGGYGPRFDFVRALRGYGLEVQAYGPGWEHGSVPFDEMIRLYARSKVVLGLGGVGQGTTISCLKGRDFEVPMCGAVYLTSYNAELADHFVIGREVLCFSSAVDCAETIGWLLRRPGDAQAIREAARARSRADHSWTRRVERALALFRT